MRWATPSALMTALIPTLRESRYSQTEMGKPFIVGFGVCYPFKDFYVLVPQFLTDGMLVREMMADPLLKKYRYVSAQAPHIIVHISSSAPVLFLLFQNVLCANAECCLSDTLVLFHAFILMCYFAVLSVLMLDEAHERTLYTDIAIGLLKKVFPSLFPLHLEQLSFLVYLKFTLHMAIKTELVCFSHSVHTAHCPSVDSEKTARPETDCGLCNSGCQGDCIIKMNRYA